MPWHEVQFFRITSHTLPPGLITCGRVALRSCALRGLTTGPANAPIATRTTSQTAAFPNLCFIRKFPLRDFERPGARTDRVALDAVQMDEAQQHIRRLPGALVDVVREHDVTVALERAVDTADKDHWAFLVR